MQIAFLKPDFLLIGEVRGHGGVGDRQVLDVDLADDFTNLAEHLLAANRPQPETHVHQPQHVQVIQAFDPRLVLGQLARRVDPADHRAHGTAGDAGDVVAAMFELFDDADMRVTPGAPGAQDQRDAFIHVRFTVVSIRAAREAADSSHTSVTPTAGNRYRASPRRGTFASPHRQIRIVDFLS